MTVGSGSGTVVSGSGTNVSVARTLVFDSKSSVFESGTVVFAAGTNYLDPETTDFDPGTGVSAVAGRGVGWRVLGAGAPGGVGAGEIWDAAAEAVGRVSGAGVGAGSAGGSGRRRGKEGSLIGLGAPPSPPLPVRVVCNDMGYTL